MCTACVYFLTHICLLITVTETLTARPCYPLTGTGDSDDLLAAKPYRPSVNLSLSSLAFWPLN